MGKYDVGGDVRSDDRYKPLPKKEMNKLKIIENLNKPNGYGIAKKAIKGVVSYATYLKYRRDDPEFDEQCRIIMEASLESVNDDVEEQIINVVLGKEKLDKNQTLLNLFYAKTRLKKRGFYEGKDNIEPKESEEIKIEYHIPAPPKQIDDIEDIPHEEIKPKEDEQDNN